MANTIVLDRSLVNLAMEPNDITEQTMYELYIDPGVLGANSRLRINLELSRVAGTPLADEEHCCRSDDSTVVTAQTLSEVATLIAPAGRSTRTAATAGIHSLLHISTIDAQTTIWQSFYRSNFDLPDPLPTIDDNENHFVYRIKNDSFDQWPKILTTTDNDFITPLYTVGIADEPVYVLFPAITFGANAEAGTYIYHLGTKVQTVITPVKMKIFTMQNDIVFGMSAPDDPLYKANLSGSVIGTSSVFTDNGFGNIKALHYQGNYLYGLGSNTVIKIDPDDMSLVDTYPMSLASTARGLWVVDESIAYVAYGGLAIGYLNMTNGEFTIIDADVDKTTIFDVNDSTTFPILFRLQLVRESDTVGYFYYASDHDNAIMKIGVNLCAG